jgi:hypothetical protein
MGDDISDQARKAKIRLDSVGLLTTEDFNNVAHREEIGILGLFSIDCSMRSSWLTDIFLFPVWHEETGIHSEWFHFSGNS